VFCISEISDFRFAIFDCRFKICIRQSSIPNQAAATPPQQPVESSPPELYDASMSHKGRFLVNLIFDPEYNGYVADVPQLPGCMSQGKTVEAALKNIRKAIKAYLKAAPRDVRPPSYEVLTSQVEVTV
jgi:predicted RNase H-like HicB family nuclease